MLAVIFGNYRTLNSGAGAGRNSMWTSVEEQIDFDLLCDASVTTIIFCGLTAEGVMQ